MKNEEFATDCLTERRKRLRESRAVFGLDFVEICPKPLRRNDRPRIRLHFLGRAAAAGLTDNAIVLSCAGFAHSLPVEIVAADSGSGGLRWLDIEVHAPVIDDGEYTLALALPAGYPLSLDPFFDSLTFSFDQSRPAGSDCSPAALPAPAAPPAPEINYLAKDYATFRQLLLDRLAVTMPQWQDRCPADVGVMLVEILAYTADHLSYYQDAVGTEAYLGTARRRQSLRRHARLVDYRIHEGCNARAWVHVTAAADGAIDEPQNMFFVSLPGAAAGPSNRPLSRDDLSKMLQHSQRCEVYEPVGSTPIPLWKSHNECHLYDWRGAKPCLPAGATSAYLIDAREPAQALHFRKNDIVIFEEVLGPWTGSPADADRSHRHAVRIAADPVPRRDELFGVALVKIEWNEADALPFPLWICKPHDAVWESANDAAVTVVRGNIVLVDHGRKMLDEPVDLAPSHDNPPRAFESRYPAARIQAKLSASNLTFSEGLASVDSAASAQLQQDPRRAVPQLVLHAKDDDRKLLASFSILELRDLARIAERLIDSLVVDERLTALKKLPRAARQIKQLVDTCGCGRDPAAFAILGRLGNFRAKIQDDLRDIWMPRYDLIDSASTDSHFVVEMADDRQAHLRFGQSGFGRTPDLDERPDLAEMHADYRIGNGTAGNAPAEAIRAFGNYGPFTADIDSVRNPLPAVGGVDPESSRQIRLFAPHAIRSQLQRAITARDYEQIVMREFGHALQRVKATLRWTGHEFEALVAVDPKGREEAHIDLLQSIRAMLIPFRRIGHTVKVRGAERVIPRLKLRVCIRPHAIREQVVNELGRLFSDRVLPSGALAFFHPDQLTFGEGIFVSQIVAAASRVAGIIHAEVEQLYRRDEGPADEIENGVLPLRPQEIVRFDNNDRHPEFGTLEIDVKGGR